MVDKERYSYIDAIRSIAIICVVLCHSVEEGIYDLSINGIDKLTDADALLAYSLFSIGRLGAPLFLMVSGYLLLDRHYDETETFEFWQKKCVHLLLCAQIWFLIYDVVLLLFGSNISFATVIADVLFLHQVTLSHVWYLPMIIGLFFLLPFVSSALLKATQSMLKVSSVVIFCLLFIVPFLIYILHTIFPGSTLSLNKQISDGFSGGKFGFYIITGYFLKKGYLKRVRTSLLCFMFLICYIFVVIYQMWNWNVGIAYNLWYDNPLVYVCSLSLFEMITRVRVNGACNFIRWFSSYAFSIFLVHNIFKLFLLDTIKQFECLNCFKVLVLWLLLVILGIVISYLLSCIPYVGNWIIYRNQRRR